MQISFGAAHMPSIKLRYSIDDENPFGIRVTRGVNSENLFFLFIFIDHVAGLGFFRSSWAKNYLPKSACFSHFLFGAAQKLCEV